MDDDPHQPRESIEDSPTPSQRKKQISGLIARLLSHYWAAGEPEALRREQATDWLTDLSTFEPMIVAKACGEWRITQTKKPTIADIIRLCREFEELSQSPKPQLSYVKRQRDPYMIGEGRRISDAWAKERGFDNLDAYAAAKGIDRVAACCEVSRFYLEMADAKWQATRSPSLPLSYDPEAMRQAREELGLSGFQPNGQAEANRKAIDDAKKPRNVPSSQDDLARRMGDDQWTSGDPYDLNANG